MGCGAGAKQKYEEPAAVEAKPETAAVARVEQPVASVARVKQPDADEAAAPAKPAADEAAAPAKSAKAKKKAVPLKKGLTATGEPLLPMRLGPPIAAEEEDDDDSPPEFLHVTCPEKKNLEDYYEICAPEHWKNNKPVWFDGQNHIYCTSSKAWAIAVDGTSLENDRGWMYDDKYTAADRWPYDARSFKCYDGKEWNDSASRINETPPPHLNVEVEKRPDLDGNYTLMSHDDPDFPVWGHGQKRLYKDDIACRWAVCLQDSTMQHQGGIFCSSTQEPIRDRPDKVTTWVCHDGTGWVDTVASVSTTTRPPPMRLEVFCPEKKQVNGTYKLQKEMVNKRPTWADGDNHIYMTKGDAWAVCTSADSMNNDTGWLYAQLREAKFPDKVEVWHAYNSDTKEWANSSGSYVRVPAADKRFPVLAEVYRGAPLHKVKKKAKPKPKPEAKPKAAPKAAAPKAAKKKVLGRMKDAESQGAGEKAALKVSILANTNWLDIKPTRSCLEELQAMTAVLPRSEDIADDVETKVLELKYTTKDAEVKLGDDDMAALVAYTHDLNNEDGSPDGNLYYEMNKALRQREQQARKDMMEQWGCLVHYLIKALAQLPDWRGECYRGFKGKEQVMEEYEMGRPIQWGAFTSVTTSWESAAAFTDMDDGVIFKIMVTNGRQISDYSFFPSEDEVLLTPSHRFTVTSDPYDVEGFTVIDLVQQKNKVFVS